MAIGVTRGGDPVVCTVAGIVEPRADGAGRDVVLDVSRLVWQSPRD